VFLSMMCGCLGRTSELFKALCSVRTVSEKSLSSSPARDARDRPPRTLLLPRSVQSLCRFHAIHCYSCTALLTAVCGTDRATLSYTLAVQVFTMGPRIHSPCVGISNLRLRFPGVLSPYKSNPEKPTLCAVITNTMTHQWPRL
jgi:hypothetical protein